MLSTLVVEDEPAAREKLVGWLKEEGDIDVVSAVGEFAAARAAIAHHQIQLAFLDIQIGGGSGLDLALELNRKASVVFVTAFDAHAVQAFDLNAVDYLLKPYTRARLAESLNRIRSRTSLGTRIGHTPGGGRDDAVQCAKTNLLLRSGNRFVSANVREIAWVESDDNYLKLHATRLYHERITLSTFLARFPHQFLQIHRSYAVNVDAIESLLRPTGSDPIVRLHSGQELRVSRSFTAALTARLKRLR